MAATSQVCNRNNVLQLSIPDAAAAVAPIAFPSRNEPSSCSLTAIAAAAAALRAYPTCPTCVAEVQTRRTLKRNAAATPTLSRAHSFEGAATRHRSSSRSVPLQSSRQSLHSLRSRCRSPQLGQQRHYCSRPLSGGASAPPLSCSLLQMKNMASLAASSPHVTAPSRGMLLAQGGGFSDTVDVFKARCERHEELTGTVIAMSAASGGSGGSGGGGGGGGGKECAEPPAQLALSSHVRSHSIASPTVNYSYPARLKIVRPSTARTEGSLHSPLISPTYVLPHYANELSSQHEQLSNTQQPDAGDPRPLQDVHEAHPLKVPSQDSIKRNRLPPRLCLDDPRHRIAPAATHILASNASGVNAIDERADSDSDSSNGDEFKSAVNSPSKIDRSSIDLSTEVTASQHHSGLEHARPYEELPESAWGSAEANYKQNTPSITCYSPPSLWYTSRQANTKEALGVPNRESTSSSSSSPIYIDAYDEMGHPHEAAANATRQTPTAGSSHSTPVNSNSNNNSNSSSNRHHPPTLSEFTTVTHNSPRFTALEKHPLPRSPLSPDSRDDWEHAKAFLRQLSPDKLRQLEQEAFGASGAFVHGNIAHADMNNSPTRQSLAQRRRCESQQQQQQQQQPQQFAELGYDGLGGKTVTQSEPHEGVRKHVQLGGELTHEYSPSKPIITQMTWTEGVPMMCTRLTAASSRPSTAPKPHSSRATPPSALKQQQQQQHKPDRHVDNQSRGSDTIPLWNYGRTASFESEPPHSLRPTLRARNSSASISSFKRTRQRSHHRQYGFRYSLRSDISESADSKGQKTEGYFHHRQHRRPPVSNKLSSSRFRRRSQSPALSAASSFRRRFSLDSRTISTPSIQSVGGNRTAPENDGVRLRSTLRKPSSSDVQQQESNLDKRPTSPPNFKSRFAFLAHPSSLPATNTNSRAERNNQTFKSPSDALVVSPAPYSSLQADRSRTNSIIRTPIPLVNANRVYGGTSANSVSTAEYQVPVVNTSGGGDNNNNNDSNDVGSAFFASPDSTSKRRSRIMPSFLHRRKYSAPASCLPPRTLRPSDTPARHSINANVVSSCSADSARPSTAVSHQSLPRGSRCSVVDAASLRYTGLNCHPISPAATTAGFGTADTRPVPCGAIARQGVCKSSPQENDKPAIGVPPPQPQQPQQSGHDTYDCPIPVARTSFSKSGDGTKVAAAFSASPPPQTSSTSFVSAQDTVPAGVASSNVDSVTGNQPATSHQGRTDINLDTTSLPKKPSKFRALKHILRWHVRRSQT